MQMYQFSRSFQNFFPSEFGFIGLEGLRDSYYLLRYRDTTNPGNPSNPINPNSDKNTSGSPAAGFF